MTGDKESPETARLRETYNKAAAERDTMELQEWKVREREAFAERFGNKDSRRLLEIGSGPGRDGFFFHNRGFDVTCIDLSEEMVERCRQKGLDARVMDFSSLDFERDLFDGVYAMNCLLHVPREPLPGVLNEIRRVLKPGGLFFWGVYGGEDSEGIWEEDAYEPKRFFSFYTDEAFRRHAREWFEETDFHTVPLSGLKLHFQSFTGRKG